MLFVGSPMGRSIMISNATNPLFLCFSCPLSFSLFYLVSHSLSPSLSFSRSHARSLAPAHVFYLSLSLSNLSLSFRSPSSTSLLGICNADAGPHLYMLCCSVLQSVTVCSVCCSVLQCVAVCCSVWIWDLIYI